MQTPPNCLSVRVGLLRPLRWYCIMCRYVLYTSYTIQYIQVLRAERLSRYGCGRGKNARTGECTYTQVDHCLNQSFIFRSNSCEITHGIEQKQTRVYILQTQIYIKDHLYIVNPTQVYNQQGYILLLLIHITLICFDDRQ